MSACIVLYFSVNYFIFGDFGTVWGLLWAMFIPLIVLKLQSLRKKRDPEKEIRAAVKKIQNEIKWIKLLSRIMASSRVNISRYIMDLSRSAYLLDDEKKAEVEASLNKMMEAFKEKEEEIK
jgi:hypothetical protein